MKVLGYINTRLYSDVKSIEVYEENGKIYAVDVRKEVGGVKPEFHVGGFCAHCSNQAEVWRNAVIVREGTPYEVVEKKGVYGYYVNAVEIIRFHPIFKAEGEAQIEKAKTKGKTVEYVGEDEYGNKTYRAYCPKKDGTPRKTFRKLGSLDKTCQWFYDYNF